jgi:hypothetical protein
VAMDHLPRAPRHSGRRFLLMWIVATIGGMLIGLALGSYVGAFFGLVWVFEVDHHLVTPIAWLMTGAVLGGVLGWCQQGVLRRRLRQISGWISATALGASIGYALSLGGLNAISLDIPDVPRTALGYAPFGLLLGLTQWYVLRRSVRRAWWWVMNWGVFFPVALSAAAVSFPDSDVLAEGAYPSAVILAVGAFVGALAMVCLASGAVLLRLSERYLRSTTDQ